MANLKKRRHKAICSECNLQVMLVSCTRDLTPNPYTTVLKQLMKEKNEH